MAFFPVSPSDGQQASVGNIVYQWSAATGAWNRVGTTVVPLVDGSLVTITGNLLVSGSGNSSFGGNLSIASNLQTLSLNASGNIIALGNIASNNLSISDQVRANGNITGQRLISNSIISATGTISSLNNITAVNTVQGNLLLSLGDISATGNILGVFVRGTNELISDGTISAAGNITSSGNISSGNIQTSGLISATGNVRAGNLIAVANVSAAGNVAGTFFIGNGAFLTGVVTGGGGGAGNRANVSVTTGTLANAASFVGNITLAAGYAIYKVTTTGAAWVRLYSNTVTQSSDSSRSQFNDPQPGAGVMVEAITTAANTVLISPAAVGWNDSTPVSNSIPITITNLASGSASITVTLTYLGLEV
jgi:hypothetical protein